MPQVSVLLSSFNHARFLPEAIESVLQQTFSDFELYIIDDASQDESWEIICRYKDPRVIPIRNSQRMRGAYGLNEVAKYHARGEFIAIHHSDDVWEREKLEKQIAFLKNHSTVAAVFTLVDLIDEEGVPLVNKKHFYYSLFNQPNRSRYEWLNHFFFYGNCLCHPSVIIRKSELLLAGRYDRRLGQLTDLDLWVRLCFQSEIWVLQEKLTKFRILDQQANQSGLKKETHCRIRNEWPLVLNNYLQRCDEETFFQIFPQMLNRSTDSHWPFLLAIAGLESDDEMKKSFGLNLIYSLLSDSMTARLILEKHSFDYPDLIALSGEVDPFHGKEIFRLHSELMEIKRVWWWKLCAPFRVSSKLISMLKSK